jgi:hypothetical protein
LLQEKDIIPWQKKYFELLTVKNLNISGNLPLGGGEEKIIKEIRTDWRERRKEGLGPCCRDRKVESGLS